MQSQHADENEIPATLPLVQLNLAKRIFLGPGGLRGGWRVLIFAALLVGTATVCIRVIRAIGFHEPSGAPGVISPGASLVGEIVLFLSLIVATAVMGRFRRPGR
jgi:hypothetical protein